jgi:hypothetical protein
MTPNNWGGYDSLTPLSEPHGQGLITAAEGPCSFIHLSVHVQPSQEKPSSTAQRTNKTSITSLGPISYTNTWSIHGDVHRNNNNSNHATTATTSAVSTTTGDDKDGDKKEEEKTKRSSFIGSRIGIRRRLDHGDRLVHAHQ